MMSALVKKEIRLLLPSWIIGLVAALAASLIADEKYSSSPFRIFFLIVLPFILSPAMVVMLTLDSFGRELSAGTFSSLLAQPVARTRIWWTKTLLLASAILSIWAVWWIAMLLNPAFKMNPNELHDAFETTVFFPLVVFSGGLWTVLLLRQVAAAFWFTLLIPAGLMVLCQIPLITKHDDLAEPLTIIVLTAYSIAGFLFARRLFLRAQDIQWSGGNIEMPEVHGLARFKINSGLRRNWRPRVALILKEFQLHQSQLIMAGALALLHLGIIATRHVHGTFQDMELEFILQHFWALWLVTPLLVGCAAVAEERKLGTLEGQLCLPVNRRTQFSIKLGTALILSVLLGAVLPLLLEGTKILWGKIHLPTDSEKIAGVSLSAQFFIQVLYLIYHSLPYIILFGIPAVTGAMAFYASSLARNTLQSLGPAVLFIMTAGFLTGWAWYPEGLFAYPLWRGALIYFIAVPVMTLVLAGLALWNFKRVLAGWNVWRHNLLVLAAALAFVIATTTAIYHRAWETFTSPETPHGATRLTVSADVKMHSRYGPPSIILPDGRVWLGEYGEWNDDLWTGLFQNWQFKLSSGNPGFLAGSNWTSIVDSYWEIVGVKADGSLWVSEKPRPTSIKHKASAQAGAVTVTNLMRFGDANDWKSAAGYYRFVWLIKTDGTLWRWSAPINYKPGKTAWPGLRAFEPQRVGTDSDWTDVSFRNGWLTFRKTDGRVLETIQRGGPHDTNNVFVVDANTTLYLAPYLEKGKWQGASWISDYDSLWNDCMFGVRDDGTFRVRAAWQRPEPSHSYASLVAQDIQLGGSTNWVTTAGNGEQAITLKADGTLWRWHFPRNPVADPGNAYATRLDTHSDWVAIAGQSEGVMALAADGSLWFWQFEHGRYYQSDLPFRPLLGPSRRPQQLANIFDGEK